MADTDLMPEVMELYRLSSDLKMLLMRWKATSHLNKEQKLQLRRETQLALKRSGREIAERAYNKAHPS